MAMYETMLNATDETHLSFVDKIFDNQFWVKDGKLIRPLKLVFTEARDDVLDVLGGDNFFVLDIEKFITALKCRILERIETQNMSHDTAKVMFDFLKIKQFYPYALRIYIHVYSCLEGLREKYEDVNTQSMVCSISGQFYSEIRECRGSLTPDLFIKLYKVSPYEVTRKLNQLVSNQCYDSCFEILGADDNDKTIARFLVMGGFVFNWIFWVKWLINAYPKDELDNELVLGLVNVICRAGINGIELKIEDYKNFIFEVLDKKIDEEVKTMIVLKLIGFYRDTLKGDTKVLVKDVVESLKNIDDEKSVMMLTNFILKL
jgi:hypothetical protein